MAHRHLLLQPVQRDCICPQRRSESHTQQCNDAFRAKFFGAWGAARERFYGRPS